LTVIIDIAILIVGIINKAQTDMGVLNIWANIETN